MEVFWIQSTPPGIADKDKVHVPYTTLTYTTGPGFDYHVSHGKVERPNPEHDDTSDFDYKQQAAIKKSDETHAGEDVPIYALGEYLHDGCSPIFFGLLGLSGGQIL